MNDTSTIIHTRFDAAGRVVEIGERPDWAAPQQWFDLLCHGTFNRYRALANGRGVFLVDSQELAALKVRH